MRAALSDAKLSFNIALQLSTSRNVQYYRHRSTGLSALGGTVRSWYVCKRIKPRIRSNWTSKQRIHQHSKIPVFTSFEVSKSNLILGYPTAYDSNIFVCLTFCKDILAEWPGI